MLHVLNVVVGKEVNYESCIGRCLSFNWARYTSRFHSRLNGIDDALHRRCAPCGNSRALNRRLVQRSIDVLKSVKLSGEISGRCGQSFLTYANCTLSYCRSTSWKPHISRDDAGVLARSAKS